MSWLQNLIGLSPEEARYVWALLGIVSVILTILGTGTSVLAYRLGKVRGWRDHRRHIDRGKILEADLVFGPAGEGEANFSVATIGGVLPLDRVFYDAAIESVVRNAVGKRGVGKILLAEGFLRHRAYERIAAHITGNERVANQSVLFGRFADCHTDMAAFMLVDAVAEDGTTMSQILKADPAQLERRLTDEAAVSNIIPLRGVHVPYRDVALDMAQKFATSKALFAEVAAKRSHVSEDEWRRLEREAGGKAEVWLVPMRATKVGASRDDVRDVVREELTAALAITRS